MAYLVEVSASASLVLTRSTRAGVCVIIDASVYDVSKRGGM